MKAKGNSFIKAKRNNFMKTKGSNIVTNVPIHLKTGFLYDVAGHDE